MLDVGLSLKGVNSTNYSTHPHRTVRDGLLKYVLLIIP